MKRGSKFLIGFAAAAITFVSLSATLGTQRFSNQCSNHWRHHHQSHCQSANWGDCCDNNADYRKDTLK
jgi:hypothetical protein